MSSPTEPSVPPAQRNQPAWREVGDRVWVGTHPWLDVNVTVVAGSASLAVVDTWGSAAAGTTLTKHVSELARRLGGLTVSAVVNTHWHFDHTFGNATVLDAWPAAACVAHEEARAELEARGEQQRLLLTSPGHPDSAGHEDAIARTTLAMPTTTFSAAHVLDLGERRIELLHLGSGHTAGDVVVHVPDADVLLAGDLVEQSGAPCYGDASFPLEWPRTLDALLGLVGGSTVVVPGHGTPVDRDFVEQQRGQIGQVAETIRHLASSGVPVHRAVDEGSWPFAPDAMTDAVRRGYAQLPRSARTLPLV